MSDGVGVWIADKELRKDIGDCQKTSNNCPLHDGISKSWLNCEGNIMVISGEKRWSEIPHWDRSRARMPTITNHYQLIRVHEWQLDTDIGLSSSFWLERFRFVGMMFDETMTFRPSRLHDFCVSIKCPKRRAKSVQLEEMANEYLFFRTSVECRWYMEMLPHARDIAISAISAPRSQCIRRVRDWACLKTHPP
jgi:hypothetical protein